MIGIGNSIVNDTKSMVVYTTMLDHRLSVLQSVSRGTGNSIIIHHGAQHVVVSPRTLPCLLESVHVPARQGSVRSIDGGGSVMSVEWLAALWCCCRQGK